MRERLLVCVCVCVCEREREREMSSTSIPESRQLDILKETMIYPVCPTKNGSFNTVSRPNSDPCGCTERERERERERDEVCVCVREREMKR